LDYSGYFRHVAFRVDATRAGSNRSIFLTLAPGVRGHFYGDGYGQGLHTVSWLLNGLIVTPGDTAPTEQGREFLALAEGRRAVGSCGFPAAGTGDGCCCWTARCLRGQPQTASVRGSAAVDRNV